LFKPELIHQRIYKSRAATRLQLDAIHPERTIRRDPDDLHERRLEIASVRCSTKERHRLQTPICLRSRYSKSIWMRLLPEAEA
jgi:hypothetical protein